MDASMLARQALPCSLLPLAAHLTSSPGFQSSKQMGQDVTPSRPTPPLHSRAVSCCRGTRHSAAACSAAQPKAEAQDAIG